MVYDAVVVGAGINGLVAAAELAQAGRKVALVDEHDRLGGFIQSDEIIEPGFIHDVYSSWHPLFVMGGGFATLGDDLARHGLEYLNTDNIVTAAVSERGVALADRDPTATAARLSQAADQQAYGQMLDELDTWAPTVFGLLGSDLSSADLRKIGWGALRSLKIAGVKELARVAIQNGRGYVRERFRGFEVDQLWSPWLLHAGLSPDSASGGMMLPVMALTMHAAGLPIVKGGASNFVAAFQGVLDHYGVDVFLGAPADAIELRDGRAIGVTVGGQRIIAKNVIASTATTRLYRDMLPPGAAGESGKKAADRHRPGRAAMQLHFTLDRPVRWTAAALNDVPLVHISNGSDSTGLACAQAEASLLPSDPTVVVGQQYVLDPSRAPEGKATLWVQLQEVPWEPHGDAGGAIQTDGQWTASVARYYVDRVLARIEEYAPGLRDSMTGTHIISPVDLRDANPNAVNGDPYGGAVELDQNLLWRPGSLTGAITGIQGLFHIGAFTHPGPGLGGGSGHLVAQHLLAPTGIQRTISRIKQKFARQ